jgi:hypothetical protein
MTVLYELNSTVMSLNEKVGTSGSSRSPAADGLRLLFDRPILFRSRLPVDVKKVLKQLAIPELSEKLFPSYVISCMATLFFFGMSFLKVDQSLDES